MHAATISRLIGLLCLGFGSTLTAPLLIALWYQDGQAGDFLRTLLLTGAAGLLALLVSGRSRITLRNRDGFLVVALFWAVLCLLAAVPFMLISKLGFVDALFEATSGLTTTGATVLTAVAEQPKSLLFYRQLLQWMGGMGLVVLAVAVLPLLGIGGSQLYRSEAPGPLKEERLTPRITSTARVLWGIYVAMTVACALAYWLAGMDMFDAVSHSFATVSTGGFSTRDDSIAAFADLRIELVAMVFMTLGAINFSVHLAAWQDKRLWDYWRNAEVRVFLWLIVGGTLLTAWMLQVEHVADGNLQALRIAAFEVISVITSTGFSMADFSIWPAFLPVLLIFISFIGGCGGSTAGGMKVLRIQLLVMQGWREIMRLIHPKAVVPVRIGGQTVSPQVIQAVWGFFAAYVTAFVLLMLGMMYAGLDQVTAFGAVATCLNNLGPGLGRVAMSFSGISDLAKSLSVFAMLLGRLEIFTIAVLLTPEFWRR
jgi:trk system potassium uptake protein TrkH